MGTARRRTQRTTSRTTATRSRLLAPETPAAEAEEVRTARAVNWQTEYKYVFNDIRQLLIISAALFVMLFVVGFFF
jgi:hypothetical protein